MAKTKTNTRRDPFADILDPEVPFEPKASNVVPLKAPKAKRAPAKKATMKVFDPASIPVRDFIEVRFHAYSGCYPRVTLADVDGVWAAAFPFNAENLSVAVRDYDVAVDKNGSHYIISGDLIFVMDSAKKTFPSEESMRAIDCYLKHIGKPVDGGVFDDTTPGECNSKWTKELVAERALDLYALERTANSAYGRAISRAEEFKEEHGIDGHVDLKREDFQAYTADTWSAYLTAKAEVRKAKARLTTASHNFLRGAPVRVRVSRADALKMEALVKSIREGTIHMKDALAMRCSKGNQMMTKAGFIEITRDATHVPF